MKKLLGGNAEIQGFWFCPNKEIINNFPGSFSCINTVEIHPAAGYNSVSRAQQMALTIVFQQINKVI